MKRTVTVLQDDIDQGCIGDSENCAIARAATRDLADLTRGGRVGCTVYTMNLWLPGRTLPISASMPLEAVNFIKAFDISKNLVDPFKFEVEIPNLPV